MGWMWKSKYIKMIWFPIWQTPPMFGFRYGINISPHIHFLQGITHQNNLGPTQRHVVLHRSPSQCSCRYKVRFGWRKWAGILIGLGGDTWKKHEQKVLVNKGGGSKTLCSQLLVRKISEFANMSPIYCWPLPVLLFERTGVLYLV